MTDAPKRWATPEAIRAAFPTHPDHGKQVVADIRRDGQPCSTDEFLQKVMDWWCKHPSDPSDEDLIVRLWNWLDGDFARAMEGLE